LDTILIFQGGGSLGAYECGVYQALSPWLRNKGHRLAVVAGTSIGAVNAAIVATHADDPDRGVSALQSFWHSVAQDSVSFLPPFGEFADWNAVWTSLLFGARGLFRPIVPFWTFMPPVTWAPFTRFYNTYPLEETLKGFFQSFGPNRAEPRLIVTAVDVDQIKPVTFDSWDTAITPRHIRASCSLPPSFGVTEVDGVRLWDGGLWSNTPLPQVLNCLQKHNAPRPEWNSDHLVFIIDLFGPAHNGNTGISGNWDVWGLRDRVLFQDKGEYDRRSADWVSKHVHFVRELRERLRSLPSEGRGPRSDVTAFVEHTASKMEEEGRLCLNIQRIVRSDASGVSREIDFSPSRIAALMDEGQADTAACIAKL
jgi:NTE family protein